MSSLMKWTEPSQNAKYPPPGWELLKPSVQVLWSLVQPKFSFPWGDATWPSAQFPLQASGPGGFRTPTQVAAKQKLLRSPIMNVLLVPSVTCFDETWLSPKKTPVSAQRSTSPNGHPASI